MSLFPDVHLTLDLDSRVLKHFPRYRGTARFQVGYLSDDSWVQHQMAKEYQVNIHIVQGFLLETDFGLRINGHGLDFDVDVECGVQVTAGRSATLSWMRIGDSLESISANGVHGTPIPQMILLGLLPWLVHATCRLLDGWVFPDVSNT